MDTHQIVSAILIVLFGGCLQGMAAFGFGLLSVPLLISLGFPIPTVLAIVAICSVVQASSGVHHLRKVIPWRDVLISAAIRAIAMLLGIWTLAIITSYPLTRIKFWIGIMVLTMLLLQASWRPAPRPKLSLGWNLAAFSASGFIGGLCSMGGPPLVMWVMAHDWTAARSRAFLFASFVMLVPLQLTVLYLTFGNDVIKGMLMGAALAPVVLLGSLLGLQIGARFSKPVLVRLAFALLTVVALNAILPEIRNV